MTDPTPPAPSAGSEHPGPASDRLPDELLLKMHDIMAEARVLEERLIRMQKQGDAYFWIGGPGEEAFNTALGLQIKKGRGLDYDFTHLHYRSSATLLAMGGRSIDALRQGRTKLTDPFSGGRNFVGHYSVREWNMCPISSPIEVQFSIAIGTAMAQRKPGCTGITIVQGGDAGTAEADFATCLVWSTRPVAPLPILMIVTNNEWGISTEARMQHGEENIADRGKPFGIPTKVIDGNDPEVSYRELEAAMAYVREERRPFLLEVQVSRLYGHSSSSGANYIEGEVDCLLDLEKRLDERGLRSLTESEALREELFHRMQDDSRSLKAEPDPSPEHIWDNVFADRNIVGEETERSVHPREEEG
jgi:2-oxoisovalerate dehydrogenase E1 component alpha subunit